MINKKIVGIGAVLIALIVVIFFVLKPSNSDHDAVSQEEITKSDTEELESNKEIIDEPVTENTLHVRLDEHLRKLYEQENDPVLLEKFLQLSDLETFMYSVKGDTLYYSNDEVTTIDLDTMEVFYGAVRDKDNLIIYGEVLNDVERERLGLDVATFQVLGDEIFKDKNKVYCDGAEDDIIKEADVGSFAILRLFSYYAIDKNYAYYDCEIIEGVDLETFEVLDVDTDEGDLGWAQDKNHKYYRGEIMLDPEK